MFWSEPLSGYLKTQTLTDAKHRIVCCNETEMIAVRYLFFKNWMEFQSLPKEGGNNALSSIYVNNLYSVKSSTFYKEV